jgi:hypothetical protein
MKAVERSPKLASGHLRVNTLNLRSDHSSPRPVRRRPRPPSPGAQTDSERSGVEFPRYRGSGT